MAYPQESLQGKTSGIRYVFVDPLLNPGWDVELEQFPEASIYHTSCWARTLVEAYRFRPMYVVGKDQGGIRILAPFMEVKSALTGDRGVSLPFSDECPPLTTPGVDSGDLLRFLLASGKERGWKYIEFRGGETPDPCCAPALIYSRHTLNLQAGMDELWKKLRDSTRRNVKKASRSGVTVHLCQDAEGMREFVRLNRMTRKMHGVPPQPPLFFQKLLENVIKAGRGQILLARRDGKGPAIAGLVLLYFGKMVEFKYGASDLGFLGLRANNLLMWEAISWAGKGGFSIFSFGRTETCAEGLLQFKRGWGSQEEMLPYWRFSAATGQAIEHIPRAARWRKMLLSRMPLSALDLIGKALYRHVA